MPARGKRTRWFIAAAAAAAMVGGSLVVAVDRAPAENQAGPHVAPVALTAPPSVADPSATASKKAPRKAKPPVSRTRAVADARAAIGRNATAIRAASGEKYRPVDVVQDRDGARHVRFQRTYRNLDVLGGDFVVHATGAGKFAGATVAQQATIEVPTEPVVSRRSARTVAEQQFTGRRTGATARLVIDAFAGAPVLAWEVTVGGTALGGMPSRLTVVVDATTGKVRRSYDQVHTADAGTGHGLHSGDVRLGTTRTAGGDYELTDADRGGNTTRDAQNRSGTPSLKTSMPFTDADDTWGDGSQTDRATLAVDVHYGLAEAWDYFEHTFGRSGVDGDGKGTTAYVHHDVAEANAGWIDYCRCMVFGDGAAPGGPFTSLDVAAHEMAHGVTHATADLTYAGESGALNEATSDIFGTLVEFAANNPVDPPDYLIGEKIGKRGPGTPLRYQDEPSRDGKSVSCWTPQAKELDVHYSSGIANKFFYLLAVGSGSSPWGDSTPCGDARAVTGIGNERAAAIWYQALSAYMVSNTNFAGAREATLRAATDLYGVDSAELNAVYAAWPAVGVDGSDPVPTVPTNPEIDPIILPTAVAGRPVQYQVTGRDPQRQPLTFSATGLPTGLSMTSAGLISGVPAKKGLPGIEVTATDPDGHLGKASATWFIKGPPVPQTVPGTQTLYVGSSADLITRFDDGYDATVDAPAAMTAQANGVPDGMSLVVGVSSLGTLTARVQGTPAGTGSGTLAVTATDPDGQSATVTVPWTVLPPRRPAAPWGTFVTGGNGTANVEWDEPYPADVPVTGYVVRVTPGSTQTLAASARSLRLTGLDVRKSYTIGVRATSANGDGAGAEKTLTLTPTSLPLTVSPSTATYGGTVTLSGRVVRGGAGPIAGAVVTLEQRLAGRSAWTRVSSVKTDAKGAWRKPVKPTSTAAYRVTYPGSYGMWAATSAAPVSTVRYAVTVNASTTKPKAKKKIKITGTVRPARGGVKVSLQRRSGSKWVTVTSVKSKATGAYTISRAFNRGKWTLRVVVAGGPANATGTSKTVKITAK